MFTPSRMTRVLLGGHNDLLEEAIDVLHAHGALHIEDYDDADGITRIGTPLEAGDEASARLVRVRGLLKSLDVEDFPAKDIAVNDIDRLIQDAEEAILPVENRLAEIRNRQAGIDHNAAAVAPFAGIDVDLSLTTGLTSLRCFIGTCRSDPSADLGVLAFDGDHEVRTGSGGHAVIAFATPGTAADLEATLNQHGFQAVMLPAGATGTPAAYLQAQAADRAAATQDLAKIEREVEDLRSSWAGRLASLEALLTGTVDKTQAPLRFGVTANTFHVEGWVPNHRAGDLESNLAAKFGKRIYVERLGDGPASAGHDHDGHGDDHHHVTAADEPPVHTEHRGLAKPFSFILGLLSRPRYNEIDPTVLLALFFPIMFGLMVGDLAVGLAIVLFGAALKTRYLMGIGGPAVSKALIYGGLFAALFGGVVFGEALGIHFVVGQHGIDEGEMSWQCILGVDIPTAEEGGLLHLTSNEVIDCAGAHHEATGDGHGDASHAAAIIPMAESATEEGGSLLAPHSHTHLSLAGVVNLGYYSKIHDITALLVWSILIALVHLTLGLLLGVRNVAKGHGVTLAIQEKVAWLTLMGGFGVLIWGLGEGAPSWGMPAGAGIIVTSIVLLWMGAAKVIGAGFIAVLEVFGFLGNILSYTRLAAVGASKAGLALAFAAIGFDVIGGAAGWVVYLLGMVVITLLAILTGGLHALRLQFVEFFGKFYEGGGRPYQPFGRNQN